MELQEILVILGDIVCSENVIKKLMMFPRLLIRMKQVKRPDFYIQFDFGNSERKRMFEIESHNNN
ncbi:hypothetical protein FF38_10346 [Lucilia cuprina]|uniref:Uncharacterized protein n=1 Tax=Lucilia cuprina TaxID=7375 RepID=A0A0L0CHG9_LUCCU|nr:hypothetical protein FF38_10346 [Lucilia cuprina]